MVVDSQGRTTISNDGATIMNLLDVVHPAARTLVQIAKAQDQEVGDGTTSVVLLTAEILKQLRPLLEEGVHPQVFTFSPYTYSLCLDIILVLMFMFLL